MREAAWQDFHHIYESSEWRTYLVLTVTFIGLPEGQLRAQLQQARHLRAALHRPDRPQQSRGCRLARPPTTPRPGRVLRDHRAAGQRADAGLVTKALATPGLATRRVTGELFSSGGEWSLPALGPASITTTYLEPDPQVEWDDTRIAWLREQLTAVDDLFAESD